MNAAKALATERADVLARLDRLGATFDDIVEAARDSNLDDEHDTEGITIAADRQQVAALIAAARRQLSAVDAAEQRVRDGSYGICVSCGARIANGRLSIRPATPWCVDCAREKR